MALKKAIFPFLPLLKMITKTKNGDIEAQQFAVALAILKIC